MTKSSEGQVRLVYGFKITICVQQYLRRAEYLFGRTKTRSDREVE